MTSSSEHWEVASYVLGVLDDRWELDSLTKLAGQGVAVAPDGSVYVAGVALRPGGAGEFDIVLLKLDAPHAMALAA